MCTESEHRHIPDALKNGPVEKHRDVDVAERSGDEVDEGLAIRLRSSAFIRRLRASIDCREGTQASCEVFVFVRFFSRRTMRARAQP